MVAQFTLEQGPFRRAVRLRVFGQNRVGPGRPVTRPMLTLTYGSEWVKAEVRYLRQISDRVTGRSGSNQNSLVTSRSLRYYAILSKPALSAERTSKNASTNLRLPLAVLMRLEPKLTLTSGWPDLTHYGHRDWDSLDLLKHREYLLSVSSEIRYDFNLRQCSLSDSGQCQCQWRVNDGNWRSLRVLIT